MNMAWVNEVEPAINRMFRFFAMCILVLIVIGSCFGWLVVRHSRLEKRVESLENMLELKRR